MFQLKVNGVAFRLIPEFDQVKNAMHVSGSVFSIIWFSLCNSFILPF